jgi:hypothetical protein
LAAARKVIDALNHSTIQIHRPEIFYYDVWNYAFALKPARKLSTHEPHPPYQP